MTSKVGQTASFGAAGTLAPEAAALSAALERVDADDLHAAAALLALPVDAAPGIDFGFTDDAISYRGVAVRRGDSPVRTAQELFAAASEAGVFEDTAFRDLSADRLSWVGSYRSGTRLYTAGMWLLLGLPDVSVPSEFAPRLDDIVAELVSRPHLAEVFAGRSTSLTLPSGALVVSFPADPAAGFATVFSDSVDSELSHPLPARTPAFHLADFDADRPTSQGSPLSPAWTAADEVVSQLLGAFTPAPEVTVVPLDSREEGVTSVELVFEHAGFVCVLPVSSDGYAASIGVELPRSETKSLPDTTLPEGFSLVGVDPFDGSYLAHHDVGYVFSLFPVGSTDA